MTDHFYWIWLIFLLFPLTRVIQHYIRKRNMQNYNKSPEKRVGMQFERTNTIEKPVRNLARPETKDMLVLGELSRGTKSFEKMQKITGLERDELISIFDDLEKRGLMRVEEKSGPFGPKVELYATDKGFKEYSSNLS
jgi:DNA-binding HxlR family transcriptional regulator